MFLRFLGGCLTTQTHCYTLEVSFFSYTTTPPSQTHTPYTEEACILALGTLPDPSSQAV